MTEPLCKADLLSLPSKVAALTGSVYNKNADMIITVTSRAYMWGKLSIGRATPQRQLMSLAATPEFYDNPRFTSVMFSSPAELGHPVMYHFADVRLLFSVPGVVVGAGPDANKFALVRLYDRYFPSLAPTASPAAVKARAIEYGDLLHNWEPSALEASQGTRCMHLKQSSSFETLVIPMSWIVQSVMVLPDFSDTNEESFFVNKWYFGSGGVVTARV